MMTSVIFLQSFPFRMFLIFFLGCMLSSKDLLLLTCNGLQVHSYTYPGQIRVHQMHSTQLGGDTFCRNHSALSHRMCFSTTSWYHVSSLAGLLVKKCWKSKTSTSSTIHTLQVTHTVILQWSLWSDHISILPSNGSSHWHLPPSMQTSFIYVG